MTLIDILDIYCILHDQDNNMMLMLQDYTLDNRIDRQAMNMAIITKLGACRPLTTNATVFKIMLEEFFNRYNYNISKLLDTMYLEYNPLYDKDIVRDLDESGTDNTTDKNTQNYTNNVTETSVENDSEHRESTGDIDNTDTYTTGNTGSDTIDKTEENLVSAYDVSTYQPKDKNLLNSTENTTNNTTHSGTTTSDIVSDVDTNRDVTRDIDTDTTHSQTDNRTIDNDTTHNLEETIKGKNSEISYQSLIEQEREVVQFNIFNWIIKQMRRELFLLIY